MSLVRNILTDLVEKRLWPIAVGLVGALVAVPLVLAAGEPAPPPAAATVAAAPRAPQPAQSAVIFEVGAPAPRERPGRVRNPFRGPRVTASKTPKAPAAAGSDKSGAAGAAPKDATTKPRRAPTAGEAPKKPGAGDPQDTYRVTLAFGQPGKQRVRSDVARLTPLPSVTDPFFVFLGVLRDGRTAAFLVSSDATATGDGRCRPSAKACETIELKAGQTEFFDLSDPDGTLTQYQLDVRSIDRVATRSSAIARAAYARHSQVGAELLRDAAVRGETAAPGARSYRFIAQRGVLVRAKRAKPAKGKADVRVADGKPRPLAPAAEQPGLALWRSVPVS